MPLYRVVEKRMHEETYTVVADNKKEARTSSKMREIENETDDWAYAIVSVELIDGEEPADD